MNGRGLVEVPENAVRDEPVALGLSGIQLGIGGVALLVAAALNLIPVWEPLKIALIILLAGPIALAAALPVRGEPAYCWLLRALRYARSRRTWQAALVGQKVVTSSTDMQTGGPQSTGHQGDPAWQVGDNSPARQAVSSPSGAASPDEAPPRRPPAREQVTMREVPLLRPHALRTEDDGSAEPLAVATRGRPQGRTPVPHLLPGLRIACFTSFAGGVGKTTLAVEVASLVAAFARYRTLEGEERPLRVALLDASRVSSGAAGIRLGLDGEALSRAANPIRWHQPRAVEELLVATRSGVEVAIAPAHPMTLGPELQPEAERQQFRADHVDDFLGGVQEAGFQLLVVDLGSHLEDGHRHLIDRADLLLGVIRPSLESLPDVHRLANVSRGLGAGRKLSLVANLADDDTAVRAHAHEYGLPIAGAVPVNPAFIAACERGEPAWTLDPGLEPALRGVAATVWPLLSDGAPAARRRGLLGSARALAILGRGAQR